MSPKTTACPSEAAKEVAKDTEPGPPGAPGAPGAGKSADKDLQSPGVKEGGRCYPFNKETGKNVAGPFDKGYCRKECLEGEQKWASGRKIGKKDPKTGMVGVCEDEGNYCCYNPNPKTTTAAPASAAPETTPEQ